MFSCILCPERYTEEDVKQGRYFVSTGVCVVCYKRMSMNKLKCFGKEKMYDSSSIICGQVCQDSVICKMFIKHKKEF